MPRSWCASIRQNQKASAPNPTVGSFAVTSEHSAADGRSSNSGSGGLVEQFPFRCLPSFLSRRSPFFLRRIRDRSSVRIRSATLDRREQFVVGADGRAFPAAALGD